MFICPDIRLAAEAIVNPGAVKGQKPYLALAVLGVRSEKSCEALRKFAKPFGVGKNDWYDIEYDNVTLNVSNLFQPGQGISVGDIKRLVEGRDLEVLQYHSTKPLKVKVETVIGEGTKVLRIDQHLKTAEGFSIRIIRSSKTAFPRTK